MQQEVKNKGMDCLMKIKSRNAFSIYIRDFFFSTYVSHLTEKSSTAIYLNILYVERQNIKLRKMYAFDDVTKKLKKNKISSFENCLY